MMERVYLVEDGLGYGERFVLGFLSTRLSRDRAFLFEGSEGLSEEMEVSRKRLHSYLKSLEEKGYLKVDRRWTGDRLFTTSVKLNLKGGKWIRVPTSFLYAGDPRERGLLLSLAGNSRKVKTKGLELRKVSLLAKEWTAPDVRSFRTLKKLLLSLQKRGFILVERTRPFYVLRVVMG